MENSVSKTLITQRKSEHLKIVAHSDVVHGQGTLLEDIRLLHQSLPELDLDEIDTSIEFFGKKLQAPLMITSMTGGAEYAGKMNRALAQAAQSQGIAFAVGSQRVMLRHPEVTADFAVREHIPDGVFLGNIGAVQLLEYSPNQIAGLIDAIEADGICVHLNAAQELVQSENEGHRNFRGILDKLARLIEHFKGRVLVKETGAGMSPETLSQLKTIGAQYIDVSGAGGTSWTKVEMHRAPDNQLKQIGRTFADWGVPTAFSIISARNILKDKACLIASGGIFSGLDVARAIAAGADLAGFARTALLAFLAEGTEGAIGLIERIKKELVRAMLLTGSKNIRTLREVPRVYTAELRNWLEAYDLFGGKRN